MPKLFDSTDWMCAKMAELTDETYMVHVAALLHIYFNAFTLKEIADKAHMSLQTLHRLRMNAPFMRLVDTYKKEFAEEIREKLLINTYALDEYDFIASDFTMFDEILQTQIKVPLFTKLKKLSQSIKSRATYNIRIEKSEFLLFKRLFSFFILIEKYSPTLTSKALAQMKEIAQETVWPALDMDSQEIERILDKPLMSREERLKEVKNKIK